MPKPPLKECYSSLSVDIQRTMIQGLREWRPDLDYPESSSDMDGCIRALMRKFDITYRRVQLSNKDIVKGGA